MNLSEFQKEIVSNFNLQGSGYFHSILEEKLKSQQTSITFIGNVHNVTRFDYHFMPEDQSEIYIYRESPDDPFLEHLWINTATIKELEQASLKTLNTDILREINERRIKKLKQEYPKQRRFLLYLQYKIAEALHLIELLLNENLIITFRRDIVPKTKWGENLDGTDNWVDVIEIGTPRDIELRNISLLLEDFLSTQIIILPALKEFEDNAFKTPDEIAHEKEMQNRKIEIDSLKEQTKQLKWGIIIPAGITLLAAVISILVSLSQPKTEDLIAITDSINQLATKVDQLNISQEKLDPQGYDSQLVTIGDTIDPVPKVSPVFFEKEN